MFYNQLTLCELKSVPTMASAKPMPAKTDPTIAKAMRVFTLTKKYR